MAFRQTVCTLAPRALRTSSLMSPLRASASIPSTFKITNSLLTRGYASGGALNAEQIQQRINDVLKSFEKVDVNKLSASSSFTSDLGLDSLDAVEVVMAIEEEFSIEIPDAEADNITTVQQAIDYISKTPEG